MNTTPPQPGSPLQPPANTENAQPATPPNSPLNQPLTVQAQPQTSTSTLNQPAGQPVVSPGSLGATPLQSPMGEQPTSPLGQTPMPQATYQAPTIEIPTTPGIGTVDTMNHPELKPNTNKPVKINGGSKMTTILYVVGGIILLVVYTVIWAVVFDLQLPFGLSLPF